MHPGNPDHKGNRRLFSSSDCMRCLGPSGFRDNWNNKNHHHIWSPASSCWSGCVSLLFSCSTVDSLHMSMASLGTGRSLRDRGGAAMAKLLIWGFVKATSGGSSPMIHTFGYRRGGFCGGKVSSPIRGAGGTPLPYPNPLQECISRLWTAKPYACLLGRWSHCAQLCLLPSKCVTP